MNNLFIEHLWWLLLPCSYGLTFSSISVSSPKRLCLTLFPKSIAAELVFPTETDIPIITHAFFYLTVGKRSGMPCQFSYYSDTKGCFHLETEIVQLTETVVRRCSKYVFFKNFAGKHLCWSLFFNKIADLRVTRVFL